jgi:hypothetical protein
MTSSDAGTAGEAPDMLAWSQTASALAATRAALASASGALHVSPPAHNASLSDWAYQLLQKVTIVMVPVEVCCGCFGQSHHIIVSTCSLRAGALRSPRGGGGQHVSPQDPGGRGFEPQLAGGVEGRGQPGV